ncbi:MAG: triacylglycerol lipase [Myxococcota bacterium]
MDRLRSLKALLHDAVDATTELVSEGHASAARTTVAALSTVPGLAEPVAAVDMVRGVTTEAVLASVRAVNRVVEVASDAALDVTTTQSGPADTVPMHAEALFTAAGAADQLTGVLNGFVGDHLRHRRNGLDLGMALRHGARVLDVSDPDSLSELGDRVVVLVHGLSTTEASWSLGADRALGDPAATFGTLLEQDLGYTPVYARYNTGLRVAESGLALATLLERLHAAHPLRELVLLGHSMGGLVSRAATHAATEQGHGWRDALTHVVCLGSPHGGAPLARFGELAASALGAVDLPATRIIGQLIGGRSVGIRDLEREHAPDLGPLLDDVTYLFLAGAALPDPDHAAARAVGDLLVDVRSAEGPDHAHPNVNRRRLGGVLHHAIQVDRRAYDELHAVLAGTAPGA